MRPSLAPFVVALASGCHAQPAAPSGPPTCDQVADHVQHLLPADAHAPKVRDVFARRCAADHWEPVVTRCILEEPDLHARHHCQDQLSAEQRTAFVKDLAAIDAPPETDIVTPGHHWPPACEAYAAAVEALGACDKLPAAARDALRQAFETASASWDDLPQEAWPALGTACQAGADAVRQSAAAACPP